VGLFIYLIICQKGQTSRRGKVESTFGYDGLFKEINDFSKPRNHIYNCPTVSHVPVRKGIDRLNRLQQKAALNNRVVAGFCSVCPSVTPLMIISRPLEMRVA
jgi:hypothetical protein